MGNNGRPLRIVVSGGIGSGKSAVLEMLRERGALVIEADRIGHEVLEPGGAAYDEVLQRWPAVVVGNRIDRRLLAAVVFTDTEQLRLLEAITHPHIKNEIETRVLHNRDRDIAVELPLAGRFLGDEWVRLVVQAPEEVRVWRAVSRGTDETDVANRIAAQPNANDWNRDADFVIDNDGSLVDLRVAVEAVWQRLAAGSAG